MKKIDHKVLNLDNAPFNNYFVKMYSAKHKTTFNRIKKDLEKRLAEITKDYNLEEKEWIIEVTPHITLIDKKWRDSI